METKIRGILMLEEETHALEWTFATGKNYTAEQILGEHSLKLAAIPEISLSIEWGNLVAVLLEANPPKVVQYRSFKHAVQGILLKGVRCTLHNGDSIFFRTRLKGVDTPEEIAVSLTILHCLNR